MSHTIKISRLMLKCSFFLLNDLIPNVKFGKNKNQKCIKFKTLNLIYNKNSYIFCIQTERLNFVLRKESVYDLFKHPNSKYDIMTK